MNIFKKKQPNLNNRVLVKRALGMLTSDYEDTDGRELFGGKSSRDALRSLVNDHFESDISNKIK